MCVYVRGFCFGTAAAAAIVVSERLRDNAQQKEIFFGGKLHFAHAQYKINVIENVKISLLLCRRGANPVSILYLVSVQARYYYFLLLPLLEFIERGIE
jgi:hypothetical protein